MKLSDTTIRNAKPADKPVRLFDGGGLYLEVSPAGGKLWRMKYCFGGMEKLLSFGKYPHVSLKDAHERHGEARKMLADGQDPGAVKQAQKAAIASASANSFEAVAREWYGRWKSGKAQSHSSKVIAHLQNDVFPWIEGMPVSEVTSSVALSVLHRIADRGGTRYRAQGEGHHQRGDAPRDQDREGGVRPMRKPSRGIA